MKRKNTKKIRWRTCTRKLRYEDKTEAHRARIDVLRRFGARLQVYRCRFCGGFHLGHKPKPTLADWQRRRQQ